MSTSGDDLAALALDAVEGDEAARLHAAIATDPAATAELQRYHEVAGALAELASQEAGPIEAQTPPAALRGRVMQRALAARPAGRPPAAPHDEQIDEVEAYRRSAAALAAELDALAPSDWDSSFQGRSVREMIAHLTAIEHYMGAQLGLWPGEHDPSIEHDHMAMSEPFVRAARAKTDISIRRDWQTRVDTLVAHLTELVRADPNALGRSMRFHSFPLRLSTLLVVRTFELWTHADDVRRAQAQPRRPIEAARLTLMTDTAMKVLASGMAAAGCPGTGRTARIVLTGEGGGTWVQSLDLDGWPAAAGEPDVTMVADAVQFCLRAANRLGPDEIDVVVTGDASLARDVLVGVGALAMD